MHDDEKFSPEESEERNQQLVADLHTLYGSGSSNEITQHLKLVRERLLQNQNIPLHQQSGIFQQPVVLETRQERHANMSSSSTHPLSSSGRSQHHYLSTIAAILFVSVLVGSLVLVFTHFHQSKN